MRKKSTFDGSEAWSVVTGEVQRLVTADSGMIRWICGMSLKDHIPTTNLLLRLGLSSINEISHWNPLSFHGHLLRINDDAWPKKAPCINLMVDNQEFDQIRDFVM